MNWQSDDIKLADIVNYSVKGVGAALGKGEGVTKKVLALQLQINEGDSFETVAQFLQSTQLLDDGDIVVIPSKVVSIIEQRFVYGVTIENYKQCTTDINYARQHLTYDGEDTFTEKDMIGLDKIDPAKKLGVRYSADPNKSATNLASAIKKIAKVNVDVVITDSDSGGKKGIALIGCPTIINTPIGATAGLRLFYCMRAAVAAELLWNNTPHTPLVLVKPYQASRIRESVGQLRYAGFLNADKEADLK